MRSDTDRVLLEQRRLATTLMAVLLVVALALVTPASGPSRGAAHDFLSVHLLFPHHHDSYVPHRADDRVDRAEDETPTSLRQPAILSAGPLADAASLASKGLAMAGLLFSLSLHARRLDGGSQASRLRQRWDAVPTGPPR